MAVAHPSPDGYRLTIAGGILLGVGGLLTFVATGYRLYGDGPIVFVPGGLSMGIGTGLLIPGVIQSKRYKIWQENQVRRGQNYRRWRQGTR